MYCGVVNEMKCDECNLDMKWFNDFPDSCRCCGTFLLQVFAMWGSKNEKLLR